MLIFFCNNVSLFNSFLQSKVLSNLIFKMLLRIHHWNLFFSEYFFFFYLKYKPRVYTPKLSKFCSSRFFSFKQLFNINCLFEITTSLKIEATTWNICNYVNNPSACFDLLFFFLFLKKSEHVDWVLVVCRTLCINDHSVVSSF